MRTTLSHLRTRTVGVLALAIVATAAPILAQSRITTPKEALGFDLGADYQLPTYTQLGPLAAVLLVVLRFAQGFGVGGEWGGAVLMAVEHAPEGKRGFYGSWPQMGVPAGLLLSMAVFALVSRRFTIVASTCAESTSRLIRPAAVRNDSIVAVRLRFCSASTVCSCAENSAAEAVPSKHLP